MAADSPAEKAGVKPGDVITSYDDQLIFVPRQLVDLVWTDKAQREVSLSIVRNGKQEQVKAMLGSHDLRFGSHPMEKMSESMKSAPIPEAGASARHTPKGMNPEVKSSEKENGWETFDSMTLEKMGNDKFKVQIQYLDENGKLAQRKFEGSLGEIHRDILAKKDLPPIERGQLLRSLDLSHNVNVFEIPGAFWMSGENGGFDDNDWTF